MPIEDSNDDKQAKHSAEQIVKPSNEPSAKSALDAWLDGTLADKDVSQAMKSKWLEDPSLAPIYQAACMLESKAAKTQDVEVPQWDASSTFVSSRGSQQSSLASWQERMLAWFNPSPRLSMAFSIAAIFMVLFKVEVQFVEGGVTVAFAEQNQANIKAQLEQQFEQRLIQYDKEQQILIANYFNDVQAKQQQDVTQLASYLINASRQERKEDLGALVSYFNEQRIDDISLNQQQLSNIIRQIQQQNAHGTIKRASYHSSDSSTDTNLHLPSHKEQ